MAICLLDTFGNKIVLHRDELGCFDPMPLGPRHVRTWRVFARARRIVRGLRSTIAACRSKPITATLFSKEGDYTHFNEKGAKVIAEMIVGELAKTDEELAGLLRE